MKSLIRGWWHVISALCVAIWLAFGWVQTVNASLKRVEVLEETTVRKDVLNETMKRIESELRSLNRKFDRAWPIGEIHE